MTKTRPPGSKQGGRMSLTDGKKDPRVSEPLKRPTRPLEEVQTKYCIQKSSEFNFQEDR